MQKELVKCMLKSSDNPAKIITLPNNKKIYIGRNAETCIDDPAVSRKQIAATADYANYLVSIETCGTNYSGCNGYALRQNYNYLLKHGDWLELLIGRHQFEVIFDPNTENNEAEKEFDISALKNKQTDDSVNMPKATIQNFVVFDPKFSSWETVDNGDLLIYTAGAVKPQTKIASFDLDGTIIKTKSGARFGKDSQDWILYFSDISKQLKQLFYDDFKIVILSNQAGLGRDNSKIEQFKTKIENIISHMNVPMQVFIAPTKSIYRKPMPGMWNALCNEKNNGVGIDMVESFYVGDAAGRTKNWAPKKNKDHAISDRLFAINLNLKFYTPEEYFLNSPSVPFEMPKFDPRNLDSGKMPIINNSGREVVVMVGCPASGKSHFCKKYFSNMNYVYINRDILGSSEKCIKLLESSLKNKQSAVIDNTNPDQATRKKYIDIAKSYNYPVRCFLMTTTLQHCRHNNKFRSLTDKKHIPVGDMILNIYQKSFQEPSVIEHFTEIVKVDFVSDFNDSEQEKLYKMFLLES